MDYQTDSFVILIALRQKSIMFNWADIPDFVSARIFDLNSLRAEANDYIVQKNFERDHDMDS